MSPSSLDTLLFGCVSDKRIQQHLKKLVAGFRKTNRREQQPLSEEAIRDLLVATIMGGSPDISREETEARVGVIMTHSLRPYVPRAASSARSPTARDISRNIRKQTIANLKKYR